MSRKIVAIGGGENGRMKADGTRYPYETGPMDREIIRLTGKKKPNFLLIAHSQPPEREAFYFETMKDLYGGRYGCPCKNLLAKDLTRENSVREWIDWADIIYEGGGDTAAMLDWWRKTGFDQVLYDAWQTGKVLCGVSAGANCWFSLCSSDSLKIQRNDESAPYIKVRGLGFFPALYTPHCNENGRLSSAKEMLKEENLAGLAFSNCAALEIVDDSYRLLTSSDEAYGLKSYWQDGKYIEEKIDAGKDWKPLADLWRIRRETGC